MLFHGRPGPNYDEDFRRDLLALQDRIWLGLSARVDVAREFGVHWEGNTTPFAWFEGGQALAHVGVISHPLRLMGKDVVVAGIHAVCVDPIGRGRGLARKCIQAALSWIDERKMLAKLSTAIPGFYEPFGFSTVPTHRFAADHLGGGGDGRPAEDRDASRIQALFRARIPLSNVYATRDTGWLGMINLALQCRLPGGVLVVPGKDFLLVAHQDKDVLHLEDVIGPEIPSLDDVLGAIPFRFERIEYHFSPDQLDPGARVGLAPRGDLVTQVRGPWPRLPPFGVPSVWEH